MIKPADFDLIKGEIADYYLDTDGILISYSKDPVGTCKYFGKY